MMRGGSAGPGPGGAWGMVVNTSTGLTSLTNWSEEWVGPETRRDETDWIEVRLFIAFDETFSRHC